ncbi:putative nuclease HARBI1 [Heterodontus francisci]|uniref:putative nuclease HARBI1 n=1 Tax=Heterodontus francisci TaxID=7792 RepID=UPI00355C41D6
MTYQHKSNHQFQRGLKMSREAVTHLCALLNDELQPMGFAGHPMPMPVALKATGILTFCTSASFQAPTGDLCGVSQSAIHRYIREVTEALYRRAAGYVCFGTDPESQSRRAVRAGLIAGVPLVQRFTDCTHVAIKVPVRQPAAFLIRKDFYSLKLQIVCDHRKCFMHVCDCLPGSCHNSFILCQSQVPLLFTASSQIQGWLLVDKGYPLQTWLLMPLRNTASDVEETYEACHGSTQAIIEQAISLLKICFRCLHRSVGALQYSLQRVARIVAVCCTLHNFATERGEALQEK